MLNNHKRAHTFFICLLFTASLFAQEEKLEGSIKGVIHNGETAAPVINANIALADEYHFGTTSDSVGYFSAKSYVGRQTITISHVNYKTKTLYVLVTSGKELQLKILLDPKNTELSEVIIEAPFTKEEPLNKLAYTSGRSFSTEEASRYAGTFGDPARMVQSYAGVTAAQDDRNDIVIRGNSPIGVQWKVNDIEVPNPNHYGGIGQTGNQVTLLNINMIDNSDFLTGAFPAEYGNAFSGVFDLKLKEGNTDKHEFRFQSGWNGFEIGAEGPFSKKKNIGSHSTTYRYSFLDLLNKIGVNTPILPQYQDFTTNLHFNLSEKVELSLLGLWGISQIELDDHNREDLQGTTGDYVKTGSDLLLGGINLAYKINTQHQLKFSLSALENKVTTKIDTFNISTDNTGPIWDEISTESKYSLFAEYTNKAIKNNFFKTGLRWDTYDVNYAQKGININRNNIYTTIIDSDAVLNMVRLYAQNEYRFSYALKATVGVNFQHLFYNNSNSIEPRAALKYNINRKQDIAIAYGLHSQIQPRTLYFVETASTQGTVLTNKGLNFSKANHYVLSHNYSLKPNLRLKTEVYYQNLYNIPVKDDPNSVYSILNTGADYYLPLVDSLVNKGKGRNYGLELTLENFFSNNYYSMFSGSFFSSEYAAADNIWRNTSFNISYVVVGLFGGELWVSNNFALGADIKMIFAGGRPYTPVDEQASINSGEVIYDDNRTYALKYDNYFRTDLKIYYRSNLKKAYLEFSIDFQNFTNYQNIHSQTFAPETGKYTTFSQRGFFVIPTFKVLF